ncbi:MAG: prepilin-type N-terminal cleavage/methylation domain-containing protein [Candidatus Acidiferrales bacterium]
MRNQSKGFSLIELLIVVAIILIIAAIAIPNLMRARISANESAAVGALRTYNTAAVQYQSSYGVGFPPAQTNLAPPLGGGVADCTAADLVDNILGAAAGTQKSGYQFTYIGALAAIPPPGTLCAAGFNTFVVHAVPASVGVTGQRSFCIDHTGVLRQQDNTASGVGTPIGVVNNQCDPAQQVVQ